jgi:hypothetical protein
MKRALPLAVTAIAVLTLTSARGLHFGSPAPGRTSTEAGLVIYPGATPKPEPRQGDAELHTVALENVSVAELRAAQYVSSDPPEKVLSFYRAQLRSYGAVVECDGGSSATVSIRLDRRALSNAGECNAEDVGLHQTELKAGDARDQHIVAVGPRDGGSEFTLVHVRTR